MPTDHYYSFDSLNWCQENEDNKSYRFETLKTAQFLTAKLKIAWNFSKTIYIAENISYLSDTWLLRIQADSYKHIR